MNRKTTIALVVFGLLLVPLVWAISTTTLVNFNINSVVAYTLTLPGKSAVDANSTGAPTADIEFTSATGTDTDVEAHVVAGDWQNSTVPIFLFDNTGTVDLNITVALNATTRPCINFTGATTHAGAGSGTVIGTSPVTVADNFAPSDPAQPWYMVADFAACITGDTSVRKLTSTGVQS
jgi:hypothetical protein